jgi:hypothetical protein
MNNPYAKYLGNQDPLAVAAATPGRLYAMLAPLIAANDERLNQRPVPGKWCMREIMAHLADTEITFGFRLRQGMAAPEVAMQPWDQEVWAERYAVYDAAAALSTFITLRNWNMLFLKTIEPGEWAVTVSHPERGAGVFRVLVETMAGHDVNHLEQIERLMPAAG